MEKLRQALTSTEQLSAPVPRALGYRAILQGRLGAPKVYNRELRNPVWAPEMEASINRFLSPERLRELPGLSHSVECRSSTCNLILRASSELQQRLDASYPVQKRPTAVAIEFIKRFGPPGPAMRETVLPDKSVAIAFAFDDDGMDPNAYEEWQKKVAAVARANIEAARVQTTTPAR
jgi:hypothetical protein